MHRAAVMFLALVIAGAIAHAQDRAAIGKLLREHHVPAVGVGVLRDGRLQQVQVFGELSAGHPAPHDAIFNVASLTKPIVSMLVLRLVSAGEWQLDEPLARYWVDPDVAADPRHKQLTTRHVLSHQTGFPNWRNGKLAFEFDPGTKFQYSGEGFEYLREALERKFGKSLAQLSRERLLAPLGMNDTHHAWDEHVDEARFARWHDETGKNAYTDFKITTVNAADNLLTTIEDYGRFAEAVLRNDGLLPAVAAEMVKPQVQVRDKLHMGLGWEVHTGFSNGEYALIHSGSDQGVHAVIILTPKSGQGLIVMTNGDRGFQLYERLVRDSLDLGSEIMARAK
ncbi:MAG: serine hydrolase domain-containing protein [Thermoanaerobaculia bacterium]